MFVKLINIKQIKKCVFIIIIVIIALFSVLIVVLRIQYKDFYHAAQRKFTIPALSDDFVPQGFTYDEGYDTFLISGYIKGTEEARICITQHNGNYRMLPVLTENGNKLICHAGGISLFGEYVYMAGCDGVCYVLSSEVLLHSESESVSVIGSFKTGNKASFCFVSDNHLYVGEYYYRIKYQTNKLHKIQTPNGEKNNALIFRFALAQQYPLGVNTACDMAISIPGRIQGACLTDNHTMILSASSIFQGSQLYYYDYSMISSESADEFETEGRIIPLYYMDNDNLMKTDSILPKAEGITICDDKIYMIFESATTRFRYGKLLGAQYVYSLPLT